MALHDPGDKRQDKGRQDDREAVRFIRLLCKRQKIGMHARSPINFLGILGEVDPTGIELVTFAMPSL
jgi:hypothetical protein